MSDDSRDLLALHLVPGRLHPEYHELIMAGSGKQAEAVLERVVNEQDGKFLVIEEGSMPTADGGI